MGGRSAITLAWSAARSSSARTSSRTSSRSVTDFLGGRSGAYESSIQEARAQAMKEMEDSARRLGADAILAVDSTMK